MLTLGSPAGVLQLSISHLGGVQVPCLPGVHTQRHYQTDVPFARLVKQQELRSMRSEAEGAFFRVPPLGGSTEAAWSRRAADGAAICGCNLREEQALIGPNHHMSGLNWSALSGFEYLPSDLCHRSSGVRTTRPHQHIPASPAVLNRNKHTSERLLFFLQGI